MFNSLKVSLHYNSTYHPQSDGERERERESKPVPKKLFEMHDFNGTQKVVFLAFSRQMVVQYFLSHIIEMMSF
jgi:hypothetical protein